MKIAKRLILLFFIVNATFLSAQNSKVVYAEFLGNGYLFLSLNYDQRIMKSDKGPGFRVGFNYAGGNSWSFPVLLNYLIGSGKHQLELGAGIVYMTQDFVLENIASFDAGAPFTAAIMYRLNSQKKSWMFRAGLTPIIDKDNTLLLYPGVSYGYRF